MEILNNLNSYDLKSLLIVNRRLRFVILNSKRLMRQLPLILVQTIHQSKLNFIKKCGEFLVEVIFDQDCRFLFESVCEILSFTPNIESLSFGYDYLTGYEPLWEDSLKPDIFSLENNEGKVVFNHRFKNLRRIKFACSKSDLNCFWNLFSSAENLEEIRILSNFQKYDDTELIKFLRKQKSLRTLQIKTFLEAPVFENEGFPFLLKKLVIREVTQSFIESQPNIESIKLSKIDSKTFVAVLRNLKKLREMTLPHFVFNLEEQEEILRNFKGGTICLEDVESQRSLSQFKEIES